MRDFKLVFGYELSNQLGKKSVRVTTFIIMLVVFALFFIPRFGDLFAPPQVALDSAAPGDAGYVAAVEGAGYVFSDEDLKNHFVPIMRAEENDIYASRDELLEAVRERDVAVGFVIKSPTAFESIWQDKDMYSTAPDMLAAIMSRAHINSMLSAKNITLEEVEAVQNFQVDQATTIMGKNSVNNVILAFAFTFVVYMIVLMYGNTTSTMIAREKDSKTMELLITSANPSSLILGKVAASGASAMIQMGLILAAAVAGFRINKNLLPPEITVMLSGTLTTEYIAAFLFYSLVGYIMYLFLYASLGSTVSKVEDVGGATALIQFLSIGAYLASTLTMNLPNSTLSVITSLFPFTSIMVMPLRVALVTVPLWQHALAGGLLTLFTIGFAFLSIKIYRWGTLNYGNKKGFFHAIKMVLKVKN